jgi:hypothetical protein
MAKCKRRISDSIKSEYLFIKGVNENAECTLCNVNFCIAHGGRSDVINHVKTTKHKLAVQNKASSNSISNYLSKKNVSVFINFYRVPVSRGKMEISRFFEKKLWDPILIVFQSMGGSA